MNLCIASCADPRVPLAVVQYERVNTTNLGWDMALVLREWYQHPFAEVGGILAGRVRTRVFLLWCCRQPPKVY